MRPGELGETAPEQLGACEQISALLSRVGDMWTVLVVRVLGRGSMRFNALRRRIGDISQKMLSTTLRSLDLGRGLLGPVCQLVQWTVANAERIDAARRDYAARGEA